MVKFLEIKTMIKRQASVASRTNVQVDVVDSLLNEAFTKEVVFDCGSRSVASHHNARLLHQPDVVQGAAILPPRGATGWQFDKIFEPQNWPQLTLDRI